MMIIIVSNLKGLHNFERFGELDRPFGNKYLRTFNNSQVLQASTHDRLGTDKDE